MKRIYIMVLGAVLGCMAAYGATSADTVVIIDADSDAARIEAFRDRLSGENRDKGKGLRQGDDRLSVVVHEGRHGTWDAVTRGLMIGFVNAPASCRGMDVAMGKSFEIAALQLLGVRYTTPSRRTALSAGIGIDWRNYKLHGASTRFIADGHGHVGLGGYPEDVNARFSRLKTFSLSFPIMIEQRLPVRVPGNARLSITGGVVLNYTPQGSMLTEWTDTEGNRVEQSCNSIGQRQFSVDFIGILRFCKFAGIYVKYSPQTVLHGSNNLTFRTFSTGLICFY